MTIRNGRCELRPSAHKRGDYSAIGLKLSRQASVHPGKEVPMHLRAYLFFPTPSYCFEMFFFEPSQNSSNYLKMDSKAPSRAQL